MNKYFEYNVASRAYEFVRTRFMLFGVLAVRTIQQVDAISSGICNRIYAMFYVKVAGDDFGNFAERENNVRVSYARIISEITLRTIAPTAHESNRTPDRWLSDVKRLYIFRGRTYRPSGYETVG